MAKMKADQKAYRVSLVCQTALVYGYGPTEDAARKVAHREHRRYYSDEPVREEIVERVTPDGARYEETPRPAGR